MSVFQGRNSIYFWWEMKRHSQRITYFLRFQEVFVARYPLRKSRPILFDINIGLSVYTGVDNADCCVPDTIAHPQLTCFRTFSVDSILCRPTVEGIWRVNVKHFTNTFH